MPTPNAQAMVRGTAEGAILSQIPFACEPDGDLLGQIRSGQRVRLNADAGVLELVGEP